MVVGTTCQAVPMVVGSELAKHLLCSQETANQRTLQRKVVAERLHSDLNTSSR